MKWGKAYLKIRNYFLSRLMRILNHLLLNPVDRLFSPPYSAPLRYPPIFIIGAPRSGSTLLIQVLTDAFDLGYLANTHNIFHGAPALAERLFRPLKDKKISDYASVHGRTRGKYAPSEAGEYWYHFFRRTPTYVSVQDVSHKKMVSMRRSISSIIRVFNKPVIFKNLFVSLRLGPIVHELPEALFVYIHRDLLENAHSLLESRYKVNGNYEQWWSVEPPNISEIKRVPAEQQVVEQIKMIEQIIDRDLRAAEVGPNRIFHVDYENFCNDVGGVMDSFSLFLEKNHVACAQRNQVPASFERRQDTRIDLELYRRLEAYIKASV